MPILSQALTHIFTSIYRTTLEAEPRIGNRHIDLFKLYNRVVAEGGYDAVSEVKLAWRKVALDFVPVSSQQIAHAFQLKTVYYKNLAYVLTTVRYCHYYYPSSRSDLPHNFPAHTKFLPFTSANHHQRRFSRI